MPKLPRTQTEIDQDNDIAIAIAIIRYQRRMGISDEELAASIGCCVKTLKDRLRDPSTFRWKELRKIFSKCRIPKAFLFDNF